MINSISENPRWEWISESTARSTPLADFARSNCMVLAGSLSGWRAVHGALLLKCVAWLNERTTSQWGAGVVMDAYICAASSGPQNMARLPRTGPEAVQEVHQFQRAGFMG